MLSLLRFMCVLCNVQSVRLLQVWVIYDSVPTQATIYYSRFATRFSSPILPAARLVSPNRSVSVVLFVFYSFSPGCKTNSTFTLYIIYFFDVYMRFRIGVRRYFFIFFFFLQVKSDLDIFITSAASIFFFTPIAPLCPLLNK